MAITQIVTPYIACRFAAIVVSVTAALIGVTSAHSQQLPTPMSNQLADGVYQWFGFGSNSLIVISDDDILITDPANNLRGEILRDYIVSLTGGSVSHIVLTHEHYDHVGGTSLFPDATVHCHVNCQQVFDLADPVFTDVPRQVDETFTDHRSITIGNKVVELHYLGPGDGEATTVVYLPTEKIVLTSDLYEDKAITHANFVDDKNFTGTRRILNTISGWDLDHAITAHSASTDPQVLRENVQYYNDLYDAVARAMSRVQDEHGPFALFAAIDSLPNAIELDQYRDWGNYDSSFTRHARRMMLSIFHGD